MTIGQCRVCGKIHSTLMPCGEVITPPDPARLAAEEICAMFAPAWVKYTDAGLPVGRAADIIRKHYAECDHKTAAVIEAADRMRQWAACSGGESQSEDCHVCAARKAFDAARKEIDLV